jgi:hypothetical protein
MSSRLTWQPPNPDRASDRPMGTNPYRVSEWLLGTTPNRASEQPMRNGPVARLSGIQVAERETRHGSRHDRRGPTSHATLFQNLRFPEGILSVHRGLATSYCLDIMDRDLSRQKPECLSAELPNPRSPISRNG